jgi:hypothetical protein
MYYSNGDMSALCEAAAVAELSGLGENGDESFSEIVSSPSSILNYWVNLFKEPFHTEKPLPESAPYARQMIKIEEIPRFPRVIQAPVQYYKPVPVLPRGWREEEIINYKPAYRPQIKPFEQFLKVQVKEAPVVTQLRKVISVFEK